jgi:3-oxoacid CoA-transferase subunit B
MDLISGAREVIVVMSHTTKEGAPKLVPACTLPLTSLRPASYVVTELATFRVDAGQLRLIDLAADVRLEEVVTRTGARFLHE